ncbi:hypothetical protein CFC21_047709, partial [Triticum aestivum]
SARSAAARPAPSSGSPPTTPPASFSRSSRPAPARPRRCGARAASWPGSAPRTSSRASAPAPHPAASTSSSSSSRRAARSPTRLPGAAGASRSAPSRGTRGTWPGGLPTSTGTRWCTGTSRLGTSCSAATAEPSSRTSDARGRRIPTGRSAALRRSWRRRWRAGRSRAWRPTCGRSAAPSSRWPPAAPRGATWTTSSRRSTGSDTRTPCPSCQRRCRRRPRTSCASAWQETPATGP